MIVPNLSGGEIVLTPGVMTSLTPEEFFDALRRHVNGDWGDIDEQDWNANNHALVYGGRILSQYYTDEGTKFWVITEADRSITTFLLPEEY
jgi:hypothetical protein